MFVTSITIQINYHVSYQPLNEVFLNDWKHQFLQERWEILSNLGEMAERNLFVDPNTTLIKLRMFGETLTKYICAMEEMDESKELSQVERYSLPI